MKVIETGDKINFDSSNYDEAKCIPVGDLLKWLSDLKDRNVPLISFSYDEDDKRIEIIAFRKENDREKMIREQNENQRHVEYVESEKRRRRAEYEKLKKEFECQ